MNEIERYIKNLSILVDSISKNNSIKNSEDLRKLREKMHEYI